MFNEKNNNHTKPGCNSEGYADPTAYLAIRKADQEKPCNSMHILYRNGQMMLRLEEFFPCTINSARKIFPLINAWAAADDKAKLREYLIHTIMEKDEQIKEIEEKMAMYQEGSSSHRRMRVMLWKAQMTCKRAERNLSYLEGSYGAGKRKCI